MTAVTPANINAVDRIITTNPRSTYQEIEQKLGIGSPAIKVILRDKLHMKKLCARWVPHGLTDLQKQARVEFCQNMLKRFKGKHKRGLKNIITGDETWTYSYNPETKRMSMQWTRPNQVQPTKVRRPRSVKKSMLIVFFNYKSIVSRSRLIPGPGRRTVNALSYTKNCLKHLVQKIKEARPNTGTRGILLHHDNASSHTAQLTVKFLKENKLKLLPHAPYSPDLAPCDFFLFPKLKEKLKGKTFANQKELNMAVSRALKVICENGLLHVFDAWLERCKTCIACNGDYFERLR
jgi:[histone H3]-lysine36 N-dimethyltransferase SETMAR